MNLPRMKSALSRNGWERRDFLPARIREYLTPWSSAQLWPSCEHPWPLLVATEFVFRFLAIHPFYDGNGRLGRALFILALLQSVDKYLAEEKPNMSRSENTRP